MTKVDFLIGVSECLKSVKCPEFRSVIKKPFPYVQTVLKWLFSQLCLDIKMCMNTFSTLSLIKPSDLANEIGKAANVTKLVF